MDEKITKFKQHVDNSNSIVFFGGAGVSTESGIPDFRSTNGLYYKQWKYPPETILSLQFFLNNTKEYYDFYRERMIHTDAAPNKAHQKLAELEKAGKLKAVITQNIDGLHQKAGSQNVIELHGSVLRNYCMNCKKPGSISESGIPLCNCGGIIRPDVVLYQESLDENNLAKAIHHIQNADMLIIGGTSLVVYPAAGLVHYYKGSKMVVINQSPTPLDNEADLVISGKLGEIFDEL